MSIVLQGGQVITPHGLGRATVIIDHSIIQSIVPPGISVARPGDQILDCTGLIVSPGLIDAHSHDDVAITLPHLYEAKIRQGVTTTAIAMDGLGYAPVWPSFRDGLIQYWQAVNGPPGDLWAPTISRLIDLFHGKLGLNVLLNIPHANIRMAQLGFRRQTMTASQRLAAADMVREGLDTGAAGVTTGLSYVPAVYADIDELLEICQPLQQNDRPYITHLRSYGLRLFEAVDEALTLGRQLGIPVHLSHLHLSHPQLFGRADILLQQLEMAKKDGVRLSWDLYPYSAGASILHSYLPAWINEGGPEKLLDRLKDDAQLEKLAADPAFRAFDWDKVRISFTKSGQYVGHTVRDIAHRQHTSPAQTIRQLLTAEQLQVGCIVYQTDERDDILLAEADGSMVGSDGLAFGQQPHPRYYGAFAAFYQRHVRERQTMTIEAAIYKMSTATALLYHLPDRGKIVAGAAADIMVFDPLTYAPQSSYDSPRQFATGVHHVLINGQLVLRDGVMDMKAKWGQVLGF